jgi:hypothetical protein
LDDPGLVLEALPDDRHGPDEYLIARRELELQLGVEPGETVAAASYRKAAVALRDAGHTRAALALTAIAGTSEELRAAAREWRDRYAQRRTTDAEEAARALMASGRVVPAGSGEGMDGLDGAWYGAAELTPAAGMSGGPAVVVTTHAGTLEVVTGFAEAGARDDWMADRAPGRTDSLAICHTGPWCRAVLEERVLAWLLCNGGGSGEGWRPHAFTTYSRSEIFLAWRAASEDPPYRGSGSAEAELRSRLLRAPAWAAPDIGWPYGQAAVAYLHRLAATPVTLAQAQAAALELVRMDRPVRGPRPQPLAAAADPRRTVDLRARHGAGERPGPRLQVQRPAPSPGGPVPRM